jgi:mannosyltransferase OCH1-like enzyme
MDSVRLFCTDNGYEYRLWTEKEILAPELALKNVVQYNATKRISGKANVARYEILYKFGGTYIDADSVVLNPAGLHTLISSFTGDVGCGHEPDTKLLANGVMLAPPNSPFLAECIATIPNRDIRKVSWKATGPRLVTDIFNANPKRFNVVVYPAHVFYPRSWKKISSIYLHKNMLFTSENLLFQYGYTTNNFAGKINAQVQPRIPRRHRRRAQHPTVQI